MLRSYDVCVPALSHRYKLGGWWEHTFSIISSSDFGFAGHAYALGVTSKQSVLQELGIVAPRLGDRPPTEVGVKDLFPHWSGLRTSSSSRRSVRVRIAPSLTLGQCALSL